MHTAGLPVPPVWQISLLSTRAGPQAGRAGHHSDCNNVECESKEGETERDDKCVVIEPGAMPMDGCVSNSGRIRYGRVKLVLGLGNRARPDLKEGQNLSRPALKSCPAPAAALCVHSAASRLSSGARLPLPTVSK